MHTGFRITNDTESKITILRHLIAISRHHDGKDISVGTMAPLIRLHQRVVHSADNYRISMVLIRLYRACFRKASLRPTSVNGKMGDDYAIFLMVWTLLV
jgi:hypothetical protein